MRKNNGKEDPTPDAEALEKVARLDGQHGAEQQYQSIRSRSLELVDRAFDLISFLPAQGAGVMPGEQPMIFSRD